MEHWTRKRILVSTLFIFSILGAAGWQWGDVTSFTASNDFSSDNYFGLTKINEDGTIIINKVAVGSLIGALVWVHFILVCFKTKLNKYDKFLVCYGPTLLALWFLSGLSDHMVARGMVLLFTFEPLTWSLFAATIFIIWLEHQPSIKNLIWIILGLGLLTGDFFFGWMEHITNWTLLATLSFVLHTLTMFSYIIWLGILLIPVAVTIGLAIALAIAAFLTCLIIAFVCLLVTIGLIILIIFALCGVSPGELGKDTGKFLLCIVEGDDPHW